MLHAALHPQEKWLPNITFVDMLIYNPIICWGDLYKKSSLTPSSILGLGVSSHPAVVAVAMLLGHCWLSLAAGACDQEYCTGKSMPEGRPHGIGWLGRRLWRAMYRASAPQALWKGFRCMHLSLCSLRKSIDAHAPSPGEPAHQRSP